MSWTFGRAVAVSLTLGVLIGIGGSAYVMRTGKKGEEAVVHPQSSRSARTLTTVRAKSAAGTSHDLIPTSLGVAPRPDGEQSLGSSRAKALPSDEAAESRKKMDEYEKLVAAAAIKEVADNSRTIAISRAIQSRIAASRIPIALESAQCGTSLCTIKFTHESSIAHADFYQSLIKSADLEPDFRAAALLRRHPRSEGGFRTTMYLSKVGTPLPAMPESGGTQDE